VKPPRWACAPDVPSIGPGDLHVWRAWLEPPAAELDGYWRTLSVDERQRAAYHHHARHQRRFVAGRGVLREVLGRYLRLDPGRIVFRYGPYGKPELASTEGPPLHFSVAHSGPVAVYALTRDARAGIDVERIRHDVPHRDIAARFFARDECRALDALAEPARTTFFFVCWTQKEAVGKAVGEGLGFSLRPLVVGDTATASAWWLHSFAAAPGYVASVAAHGRPATVTYWHRDRSSVRALR